MTDDPDRARFLERLQQPWLRLVLSGPQGGEPGLQRVTVRPIVLKDEPAVSFVASHATRDLTHNRPRSEGLTEIASLLGSPFRHANLFTERETLQLKIGKRGTAHLTVQKAAAVAAEPATHDREKQRWLRLDRPFLTALGVTTKDHQLVPSMARKWKQINKFVEIVAHAIERSPLAEAPALRIVDFGAGKAYLTFAVHDWLSHGQHRQAEVVGVELRPDLVQQGQATIAELGLQGLRIEQGDVREWRAGPMDVMIALHACDTATDHAIHLGIQSGASIILSSPCCHKQLRPQLLSPHPLRSVFQHGIHAEQQAEMLTDSLRALLLESRGYDTQVFEFVALEHTRKNKMILAVKRPGHRPPDAALAQVAELKRFFGIREQALEALLQADTA